jgi:hypothetical protein
MVSSLARLAPRATPSVGNRVWLSCGNGLSHETIAFRDIVRMFEEALGATDCGADRVY